MIADMDRTEFVSRFGGVYEHSRWVAEKCFDQAMHKSASLPSQLAGPMSLLVESADRGSQMIVLRAHPDLAGKLARGDTLTRESTVEQADAGLDHCTDAEFDEFTALNTQYREKFGFPYILAVKGRHRVEILENFRARLPNDIATEFREALNQVHQIARLRLQALDKAG